jgi:hypothetical protein
MRRVPIVCPKCGTEFDPEVFTKTRRSRPQPVEEKKAPPPVPEAAVEAEELPAEEGEFEEVEEEGGEEEDVIEDASELDQEDPVVGKVGGKGDDEGV